jgi:hypothetical protein
MRGYARVSCDFLEEMLSTRGFGSKWRNWFMSLVKGGSISIRLNDINNPYFKPSKGLRQGDLLSLLFFNLVVDVFTRMFMMATKKEYITSLMNSLYPKGVINLQYADGILFLENDTQVACHLKWLMVCFEQLSSMKINYHKSDLTPINLEEEEETKYFAKIFCCKIGSRPFKYLGVPLHYDKLRKEDIQPVLDNIINRVSG